MTIVYKSNLDGLIKAMDRLEGMPDFKTREELDQVLHTGFLMTQEDVHVESGDLKASGEEDSSYSTTDNQWEGTIKYGATGPVDYAIYEKRRGIGGAGGPSDLKGDHDMFQRLPLLDPAYVDAIERGLKG